MFKIPVYFQYYFRQISSAYNIAIKMQQYSNVPVCCDQFNIVTGLLFSHSHNMQFYLLFQIYFFNEKAMYSIYSILYQVKGIPITGHEGPSRMWMQGSTYSQSRHQEEVGWLVLCSATFTPREIPRYLFYRRLSGPQGQSGHEGVKKNLQPSNTRDRTQAIQPIAKRFAA